MSSRTIDAQRTGGTDQTAWTRSRYAALVDVLRGLGVASPENVAAAVVAHWARETGWGRSEWWFNVGNIKDTSGWTGDGQVLPDGLAYRAYPDLASGVRDTVALLRAPRYAPAWNYLVTTGDGLGWYNLLMHAGWHPWTQTALDEYASIRARVGRLVNAAAPVVSPLLSTAPAPAGSGGAWAALAALLAWAAWKYR